MKILALLLAVCAVTACSTATRIQGANGEQLVMVQCGASTSSSVCYERAKKECPNGYKEVDQVAGLNRQELRVQCITGGKQ